MNSFDRQLGQLSFAVQMSTKDKIAPLSIILNWDRKATPYVANEILLSSLIDQGSNARPPPPTTPTRGSWSTWAAPSTSSPSTSPSPPTRTTAPASCPTSRCAWATAAAPGRTPSASGSAASSSSAGGSGTSSLSPATASAGTALSHLCTGAKES